MEHLRFFGLRKEPFKVGPDPAFFYMSPSHEECLARILLTLELNSGLFVAIGDAGTGKTTLSTILIRELLNKPDYVLGVMKQPRAKSEYSFMEKIANAFELPTLNGKRSIVHLENSLFTFIQKEAYEKKKKLVLVIDEGQEMTPTQLLKIRELLNLETDEDKLINIVIFAQLEFMNKIKGKRFKNFRQRVAMSYLLNPLNLREVKEMIQHRLKVAGWSNGRSLFTDDAITVMHVRSRGLPRDVCKFCSMALLSAFTQNKESVDKELMETEIERILIQ